MLEDTDSLVKHWLDYRHQANFAPILAQDHWTLWIYQLFIYILYEFDLLQALYFYYSTIILHSYLYYGTLILHRFMYYSTLILHRYMFFYFYILSLNAPY